MMACSIKTKNWSARFIRRRCENCNMKAQPCKLLRVVRRACRYAYCCMFRDCVSSSSCGCGKHGTITFPSLCSGSPPRRVHSSSSMSPLLTTFRVCGLLRAEFEKALPVTTSRSCIRRAVLMRPSAARACSSSSCRRLLKSSRPSLEALGAADGGFTWAA